MVHKIYIKEYRKLKSIELDFSENVNIISGTNGTCKTSILHIISNSFQKVTAKSGKVNNTECLSIIRKISYSMNPKIESLTKGDKRYNNPAPNIQQGGIFSIEYFDSNPIEFRRHNSDIDGRYSVKPHYSRGMPKESLPALPILYLGLSRLFPFGEFQDDDAVKELTKSLPTEYFDIIADLYKSFTHINTQNANIQFMGRVKNRATFESSTQGIDSNTISAGEDNLYIILLALVSLRYYYDNLRTTDQEVDSTTVESILLIDEMDATLHPSFQKKLLDLFIDYSNAYKIQIVCTSHSLTLLEYALKLKCNVVYLIDNIFDIIKMDTPDIYKIKMHLNNISSNELFADRKIPIFTEDNEARVFLDKIFDYFQFLDQRFEKNKRFSDIRRFLYCVNASIGAENLKGIFSDNYLIKSTLRSICVLDGDHKNDCDIDKHILALPGTSSPEELIMQYAVKESQDINSPIWRNSDMIELNYTKSYFIDRIYPDIQKIQKILEDKRQKGESTKGIQREENKKVFNKFKDFFLKIFEFWLNDPKNEGEIMKFYMSFEITFRKVAPYHEINHKLWDITTK